MWPGPGRIALWRHSRWFQPWAWPCQSEGSRFAEQGMEIPINTPHTMLGNLVNLQVEDLFGGAGRGAWNIWFEAILYEQSVLGCTFSSWWKQWLDQVPTWGSHGCIILAVESTVSILTPNSLWKSYIDLLRRSAYWILKCVYASLLSLVHIGLSGWFNLIYTAWTCNSLK